MNFLATLFAGLGGTITAVVNGWQTRATARVEAEVRTSVARADAEAAVLSARARMAEAAQTADASWDIAVASQMDRTWKDEFYVLLFSIPLVLAFVAPSIVDAGFTVLDRMPAWYFFSIGTMIAATFGMRRLLALFEKVTGR